MDALQVVSSAAQIVASMVGAVSALEQASRNLDEAPSKIRSLEEFASDLEKLMCRIRQKHVSKLHNPKLERQIQSLNVLIERLHPKISKARKFVSKSKAKNFAKVVWLSMVGDPLVKMVHSIRDDLNWWLESQRMSDDVEKIIESTAKSLPVLLKVSAENGYPISNKCHHVRWLLEQDNCHRVILIVGLSGIGKSCLARQVASDLPRKFVDGSVELVLGQWCSRAGCNGSKAEYHKRLAKKIYRLLVQLGFKKKFANDSVPDLEEVCYLLQEALTAKSILILLDDVWEQDIVERFAKLYDNDCRYLVTTRNEAVYEVTEAEKVEICKEDIKEISKSILLHHSLLKSEELPSIAEILLDSCGHHPLTVAVMGKALRKETRAEKWEKAICNLTTYATSAPGPLSYVNEKESENTLTVFGSFEFSLEVMPDESRKLFMVMAALSWAEPVPEACIEALWTVLGPDNIFPLIMCKLVEGSLVSKSDSYSMYHVHDMVSLYLNTKIHVAIETLLFDSSPEGAALAASWLLVFGKETVKELAEEKIIHVLQMLEEKPVIVALDATVEALMASNSISELEASRSSFSGILGPRILDLITEGSEDLIISAARAIIYTFVKYDYHKYVYILEAKGAIDKLTGLLETSDDPLFQTTISAFVAKMAECGNHEIVNKILPRIPITHLANLLGPDSEEWHEIVLTTLMSLAIAGKVHAVEKMIESDVDKKIVELIEEGSDVSQHHAMILLKTIYQLKGRLRPGILNLLPWYARHNLEMFVLPDKNDTLSPKAHAFEPLVHKIVQGGTEQVLEALQDLIPIVEKAGEPRIRATILDSPLIEGLASHLRNGSIETSQTRSETAFLLMKLACSGGELCIRKYLKYDVIPGLLKMMDSNVPDMQDSACTALHEMLFGDGGTLLSAHIFKLGLVEKLVRSLDSKSFKTKEAAAHCLLDLVEIGSKPCLERIIVSHVVEKFVMLEKMGGKFSGIIMRFLGGLNKCKNLSTAERKVMKQQVARKVKASVKGHKLEAQLMADVNAGVSDGSGGASTSKQRKR